MTWYFWLSFIVACILSAADIWSSRDMQYYNSHEANPLMRDKYGYFSMPKQIIGLIVIFGAGLILEYFTHSAWVFFGIIGVGRGIMAAVNVSGKRKMRKVQVVWLDGIAKLPDDMQVISDYFFSHGIGWRYVNGRLWLPFFAWFYEDGVADNDTDKAAAVLRLERKVYEFAKDPNRRFPS